MKNQLFLVFFWFISPGSPAEENLGRLFYSQQQREQLNHLRQQHPAVDGEKGPLFTLDGEVRRSSGQHTHWINAQAQVGQRPAHLLQTPVGDSIETSSGAQQSLLGTGQLIIKRPPAP
jgi:hypothetical protein